MKPLDVWILRARWPRIVVLLSLAFASAAGAVGVRIPGTGVTLEPPAGFKPSARFPGFEIPERAASLMVTEIPGPLAEIQKGMTAERLAAGGMTLLESSPISLGGSEGLLLRVSQKAAGLQFFKWMAIAGGPQKTYVLVGTWAEGDDELGAILKRSIASATWGTAAPANPYEGLVFRAEPTAKLKLAGRVNNLLLFSETGGLGPFGPEDAFLVVGNSLSSVSLDDLEAFARARAEKTEQIDNLREAKLEPASVDGLRGIELVAQADDKKTGKPVVLYQLVLREGSNYYLVQGLAGKGRAAEALPEFRSVARSFRRVSSGR